MTSRVARYLFSRRPVLAAGRWVVKSLDPSVFYRLWAETGRVDPSALDVVLAAWLTTDLVVADVGARWGVDEQWRRFQPHVRVVGFDPDEDECRRLNELEENADAISFVPVALGPSAGTATLYVTHEPACSSLYPPIDGLIQRRPMLEPSRLRETTTIAMTTLDQWFEGSGQSYLDVLKLDTQGAELGVLQGGTAALATVQMLEVEVEFNELYAGQPLFGEVDRFLRERGFVLWRLRQLVHYGLDTVASSRVSVPDSQHFDARPQPFSGQGGQLFWGHAYYIPRDVAFSEGNRPWQEAVRGACASSAFGFVDLALSQLLQARAQAPSEVAADLDRLLSDAVAGF
ncbi:MAG: FkbM family methyltransferase [Actinomycetota bacterium]|nr:FkbM family methyltransferase [Actinomycetota bacterium]